jgi:hypothetical protein
MSRRNPLLLAAVLVATAHAGPAPFDLAGPGLEVDVTRGALTLPVTRVPTLSAGDRLSIRPLLPSTQSAHYLLVAAFLRGATNPPPADWFFKCKTWTRQCVHEGLTITVPQEAQQVLVFLAPQTGGDFKTLVNAARGRPGAFVRASQDLNQAALDRSRLENYLAAIRVLDEADPELLKQSTPLLARSLAIKVDAKCLDRSPELQAPCLAEGGESLILDDGHSTSIVEALTSGPASDLAMEASFTPQLGYGYYSPYIASVLDIARIMSSFNNAQYQYIPALASQRGEQLALTLNSPPSFHDPKSVLVTALPPVEPAQLPPLHAINPKDTYCARKPSLVLPVEGAPLVFSTGYAHDVSLTLSSQDGKTINLPAKADAARGGFVVDTSALRTVALNDSTHASLHGNWGFDAFEGPGFQLVKARAESWQLPSPDDAVLIAGRAGTVHLQTDDSSCLEGIILKDSSGKEMKADWKRIKPNEVDVTLALQQAIPGPMTLLIAEYGANQPQAVRLRAFSEAGHLDGFAIHAGDSQGTLKGTRLDEVAGLVMRNILFVPGKLASSETGDELSMEAPDAQSAAALKQGEIAKAKVTLKDGRVIDLRAAVNPPRPRVTLIGKSMQPSASVTNSNIALTSPDELPQGAMLTFSLHAQIPAVFSRDETIDVATIDGSYEAILSVANGGITLETTRVAVARLDPEKLLGPSAFGPLQFRAAANGVAGDWQPLATLVRLPLLEELECPSNAEQACKLSGSNLYLVDSVSSDPQFSRPVQVPDGFPGSALPVPHPTGAQLYVKLRDDPSVISRATLVAQSPPTPDGTLAQQSAARSDLEPQSRSEGDRFIPPGPVQWLRVKSEPPAREAPSPLQPQPPAEEASSPLQPQPPTEEVPSPLQRQAPVRPVETSNRAAASPNP